MLHSQGRKQAKAFVDRVCDDLSLIETQEHKDEIFNKIADGINRQEKFVYTNDAEQVENYCYITPEDRTTEARNRVAVDARTFHPIEFNSETLTTIMLNYMSMLDIQYSYRVDTKGHV